MTKSDDTGDQAKITEKTSDATTKLSQFVDRYVGGSLEQAFGMLEDRFRFMRWERLLRLIDREREILAKRGLEAPDRSVPLSVFVPLVEAASLEENDSMQDRWATLLANAGDSSQLIEIRRAFVSILENLTPLDAAALDCIYSYEDEFADEKLFWTKDLPERVLIEEPTTNRFPRREVEISLGNLARLGLLVSGMAWSSPYPYMGIYQTNLGQAFHEAISEPKEQT